MFHRLYKELRSALQIHFAPNMTHLLIKAYTVLVMRTFVSETSCENGNRNLDRSLVVLRLNVRMRLFKDIL